MTAPDPEAAGRRFRTYFTAICIDIRRAAGASFERVGDRVGVSSNSIRRFELGEHFPDGNLERYAAGYASLPNPPVDPRDIFARAAKWWRKKGLRPLLAGEEDDYAEPTPEQVMLSIRQADTAEQERAQADEQPIATRKRRRASE